MFLATDRASYTYNRRTGVEPVPAVREITVQIARGSLTGLIGPNGCGKTTLLKLLAGVLTPDSGTVVLDGRALTTMSRRHIARRIAVVPQETHPAFEYSVLEMALMGRHPHLGSFQLEGPADLAIAHESLDATGTLRLAERSYMALSGGEKQRLALARGLLASVDKDIILLDEPTSSVDFQNELEIFKNIFSSFPKQAIIASVHRLHLLSLFDTVYFFADGKIISSGTFEHLKNTSPEFQSLWENYVKTRDA
jgi:iron complex transport system ATP-binding protein